MNWNYKREETFKQIPPGTHRVRIEDVEKTVSQAGNDMLVLHLSVSGYNKRLRYYLVFLNEYPEMTNERLTQIYDSFGIPEGSFDIATWVGKVGAAIIRIGDDEYEEIRRFIHKNRQDALPPWEEPKIPYKRQESVRGGDEPIPDDEMPF